MIENPTQSETRSFMKFAYQIHESLIANHIMMVYEGEVNQDITKAFTALTQKNLDEDNGASVPIKKRVYHVMVECLQNIGRHSDNVISGEPELPGTGIFMVSRNGTAYSVVTGNPIANTKIADVTEMLNKVNGMDQEQIKAYYKEKILASRISEKGGAGLGFIDIVKKTGNKIDFHFEKINEVTSFFIVKTQIS
jgi:Family of unknown function (DUF6272)